MKTWGFLVLFLFLPLAANADERVAFFERRIRPLLVERCYECHSAEEPSGNLRLDTAAGWKRGGERGPAVVPGDPAASLLFQAIQQRDPDLRMPPPDAGPPLTRQEVDDVAQWIRDGAADPRDGDPVVRLWDEQANTHWALQPVHAPDVPPGVHPIDFLIQRRLAEHEFTVSATADLRTLVRRATYDLHGLPPTPSQLGIEREHYSDLVAELLSSPRYGERWARHWLDVARYSDAKDGVLMYGDARIRPFAYTYRDYVIHAFNEDLPFTDFIREQLAADQLGLPPDSPKLAALGFLTLGRMFDRNQHDVIDDQIDVVTRGFLGLTVSCARCHDHKFDPVPTADYYSLHGVFASSVEPLDRPRIESIGEAGREFESEFAAKLKEILEQQKKHYDETLQEARARTEDYLAAVATTEPDISETKIFFLSLIPGQLRPQITFRWRKLIERRAYPDDPLFAPWHDFQREPKLEIERWRAAGVDPRVLDALTKNNPQTVEALARVYGRLIHDVWQEATQLQNAVATANVEADGAGAAQPEQRQRSADLDEDPIAALLLSRESPVWFPERDVRFYLSREPGDAFRGLCNQLDAIAVKHSAAAARAMVLVDSESPYDPVIFQRGDPSQRGNPVPRQFLEVLSPETRQPFGAGSGRLDLANAIASPRNPLTARVWVNRVWMHHFGAPLVSNPSDFGLRTARPVQHELLDFLAAAFIEQGWRTKPLHQLIMTSQAYQRDSRLRQDSELLRQAMMDPDNAYLWRGHRRRLDLEQMRDSVLAVSGQLDLTMFGRPPLITNAENRRRTIYAFVERQNLPNVVQVFDFANADTSTAKRTTTIVPQQALFAMNSSFFLQAAEAIAERVTSENEESPSPLRQLYLQVLGRPPTAEEDALAASYLASHSLTQLAQVLLMTNEFMFVD